MEGTGRSPRSREMKLLASLSTFFVPQSTHPCSGVLFYAAEKSHALYFLDAYSVERYFETSSSELIEIIS